MVEVRQTEVFVNWLRKLRDGNARSRIQIRIRASRSATSEM
jgi:putative component of toxin-antitoxin plasmid stabilization module